MRDVVIHGYDVVNLERVWAIIEEDLPALLEWIDERLPAEPT